MSFLLLLLRLLRLLLLPSLFYQIIIIIIIIIIIVFSLKKCERTKMTRTAEQLDYCVLQFLMDSFNSFIISDVNY